jgi:sterol 3beta-glucosyltransferase
MRAIIANFGSAGDLQPYLALIMELRRNGHDAAFAFSPQFAKSITRHGVEFIPIGPDFEREQYEIITESVATPNIDYATDQMRAMFAPLAAALPQMFGELIAACSGADVLVSGPLQPASPMIHELTGIPFVSIQDAHFFGSGTPAYQETTAALINPFRELHGLPTMRNPLTHDANSPQLAIYATSRHVLPPPADWPAHYHMVGYFFFEDAAWRPDPALVDFIAAGEPPVVFTFSSMTHTDPQAVTSLLLDAIGQVGCRAIIQRGWSGLAQQEMPRNVFAAGFAPHTWLFEQASCVVHHGGAGTGAAAFRAGVPTVYVPHVADQPLWAQLAHEMGLTVPPIPITELTADRLADAVSTVLATPSYKTTAAELRDKIRAEPGVRKARLLIEELVSKIGLHKSRRESQTTTSVDVIEGKVNRRKSYQQQQRSRKREAASSQVLEA